MRIVSWNINGQRTLRGYRPWYSMKSWAECLNHLEADLICFQEVKMTRKALLEYRDMCLPDGYEAYYSLHPTKGYSGVSTFAKTATCQVARAEMGLTGELVENRRSLDSSKLIGGYPDVRAPESPLYDVIDAEGRAVLVDCGLFVLFNLYCPNETDEGRRDYKMAFYHTLAERVGNLLQMGREVIIVGDLNIAHLPIDHCEGVGQRTRDEHLDIHPARRWLDQFLAPKGEFYDVTRMHHPTRRFMYTCWDTLKDTRPCNYGVRIDYVFVSKGILPWVKFADIQPSIFGSDHCPVFVDLYDEMESPDGTRLLLSDAVKPKNRERGRPPALATCSWPEFSGRRIQSFFAPSSAKLPAAGASAGSSTSTEEVSGPIATGTSTSSRSPSQDSYRPAPTPPWSASADVSQDSQASTRAGVTPRERSQSQEQTRTTQATKALDKRNLPKKSSAKGVVAASNVGQSRLQSFFIKAKDTIEPVALVSEASDGEEPTFDRVPKDAIVPSPDLKRRASDVDRAGEEGMDEATQSPIPDDSGAQRVESALAWGSIFAPKEPPLCTTHGEPAKPWTVNKAGPNHGRKFWMCARPVGDAGTGNPADNLQYRCSFWKWDSDVRKRQKRQDKDLDGSARSFHDVAGTAPRLASGEKRGPESLKQRAMHKSVVPREK